MIAQLITALQRIEIYPTARELAETLWFALQINPSSPQPIPEHPDGAASHHDIGDNELSRSIEQLEEPKQPDTDAASTASLHVLTSESTLSTTSSGSIGLPFDTPTGSALPGSLALGRALRPFIRRTLSRSSRLLDEGTTADRIAEEQIWVPVFRPIRGRWFDVVLVIDEGASMPIWHHTIAELRTLLERHGAFRDVRVWGANTDAKDNIVLFAGGNWSQRARRICDPRELADPTGRRLILVVSDCVSPAWHSGVMARQIKIWRHSSVAIIQMLPERFWSRTALYMGTPVRLRAIAPEMTNKQFLATRRRHISDPLPEGLNLPVITLDPESFAGWARLLAGAGASVPGFVLPAQLEPERSENTSTHQDSPTESYSAEQLVRSFRYAATPLAFRLAGLFAAAPRLNLHIMRLIRQALLPEARQTHMAEVFLGGFLQAIIPDGEMADPEYVRYDFIKDVRKEFLKSVPTSEAARVLRGVSRFVAGHYGQSEGFDALLKDPTLPIDDFRFTGDDLPFAEVTVDVLKGFGGKYTELANRLEQRLSKTLPSSPVVSPSDPGVTRLVRWPSASLLSMSNEQWQRWLETCHLESNVDQLFVDPDRSVVVITHAGCGITTSLALLHSYDLLSFQYDPDQWPGQREALTTAPDHFGQWMSHIAFACTEEIKRRPALLEQLTFSNYEFLTWLMRRYFNRRQANHWVQYLEKNLAAETWQALSESIDSNTLGDLYGETVADLFGQIVESLEIARHLGWKGIYASIDIHWVDWISRTPQERDILKEHIKQLLTTITPLQRPGFGFKMGLPHRLFSLQEARALVRGRATVVTYDWTGLDLSTIAIRIITLSIGDTTMNARLLVDSMWQTLEADVASIWEVPGPAAAVALARLVLSLTATTDPSQSTIESLRKRLYHTYAHLRLDKDPAQRQVWRGTTPIKLTDTLFRFFEVLWHQHGEPVSVEVLQNIAGSKDNLNKNISRIREAIEPLYKQGVFLYIRRDLSSTWLEKELCHYD